MRRGVFGLAASALVATATLMAALPATTLAAYPEPSSVVRWELKFDVVHDLRLINLGGEYYWFMTYMVTNRTGEDQIFAPIAVMYTDTGDIIREGENVPFEVTQSLLQLMNNPLLESTPQIIGTLRQGRENAREGLLVWKAGSLELTETSIFIAGLSSHTELVANPVTGETSVVRKTLHRKYRVPGLPVRDPASPVKFVEQEWTMR